MTAKRKTTPRRAARRGPTRIRPRSRRARRREAARRIEALLDQARGRPRDDRDHRREGDRWQGFRTLEIGRNRELFDRLVALDYDYLLNLDFAADLRTLGDLLPQSVVGRAQNGHGWFSDEFGVSLRFPDATFERVLTVLEADDPNLRAEQVRRRRSHLVHELGRWLLAHLDSDELTLVHDGRPLLGVDFLADCRVQTRPFLQGMVLAGFMDDWRYRETAMLQHKHTFSGEPFLVGGGEILVVDRQRFDLVGLGDTGQSVFTDDQLRTLRDLGVICGDRDADHVFPAYDQAFFRRRLGDGVCDDLAMIWVGARYGLSGLLGAFVMDAIDTYDKYLLEMTWGGYDAWLARRLQDAGRESTGEVLVGDEAILDLIHFAAKRNDPPLNLSSSHRRLIQIERKSEVPTILNHWRFLQGEPVYDIKLGFSQVPARQFYDVARRRLQSIGVDVPEPEFIRP